MRCFPIAIDTLYGKKYAVGVVKNFVIVDYENVQPTPEEFALLRGGPFELWICCGAQQSKFSTDNLVHITSLCLPLRVVKAKAGGAQALDMLIAFFVGELALNEPTAFFHFISKDTHFQRFIENLRAIRSIKAACWSSIREIGILNIPVGINERISEVRKRFNNPKTPRSKTRKGLKNILNGFFYRALEEGDLEILIEEAARRKIFTLDGEKVTGYAADASSPVPAKAAKMPMKKSA